MKNVKNKIISQKEAKELLRNKGSHKVIENIGNIERITQKDTKQSEDVWLIGDASSDFQSLKLK